MRQQVLSDTLKSGLGAKVSHGFGGHPMRPSSRAEMIPFSKDEAEPRPGLLFSMERNGPDKDQERVVRDSLRRLLHSQLLVQSDRLSRFLTFAVEATLRGDASSLKEYTIGIEAYGRRPDFDPSQDSIVRTEARRLRMKLKKYYQEEGGDDPVVFDFRPGSYVPTFSMNPRTGPPSFGSTDRLLNAELDVLAISVLPFEYLSGDLFGESCARGLTDEVMHQLTRTVGVRVFTCSTAHPPPSKVAKTDSLTASWITSDGIVRTEGKRIRVTSRLSDAEGLHVASWRFDAEANHGELFGALEKIASDIVSCINQHKTVQLAC